MDLTYSEATFKLAVVDPCVNAIVNSDGALQLDEEFIAPQEAEIYESVFYDQPSNSGDLAYIAQDGDLIDGVSGYCGPISYKILNSVDQEEFSEDWLEVKQ